MLAVSRGEFPMRLRLYCNRYEHFKEALVCSVNCVYRTRCQDFALFYDDHRDAIDASVAEYYAARRAGTPPPRTTTNTSAPVATPTALRTLIRLEVKREMADSLYIWIDKEDRAELIATDEVLRRAERGSKAKHIYKVAQEMELRFQLVPRKRIDKARRNVAEDAARADARRSRTTTAKSAPPPASATTTTTTTVPFPTPIAAAATDARRPTTRRRTRTRAVKVAGER